MKPIPNDPMGQACKQKYWEQYQFEQGHGRLKTIDFI